MDERIGQAFVSANRAGTVLVLDGHTAMVIRTVVVPWTPGALAVDERTGTVVVAHAYDNNVSLVEAASGRVGRTVPLGLPPLAIAVDQRGDRVLVLTRQSPWPSTTAYQVAVLDRRTEQLLGRADGAVATHRGRWRGCQGASRAQRLMVDVIQSTSHDTVTRISCSTAARNIPA